MKIFFDYRIFLHQAGGGISRYIINLSKSLNEKKLKNEIFAPIHINKMLKDYSLNLKKDMGFFINRKPLFTSKILDYVNSFSTQFYINKIRPNVYHQTYYGSFPKLKKTSKVVTVHDLIHEKFHEYYGMPENFRPKKKSLEQADKIICVSKTTKEDLLRFYNLDEKKIKVINHGHEHILNLTKKKNLNKKNEILYVGGRGKYKNFKNFVQAFVFNQKLKNEFRIVCFGGGVFNKSEINFFSKNNILDKIRYVEGNDYKLAELYNSSICLVYPSLYEGFGLPIIESMAIGCPVLASEIKPIIETAGDAVIYFNPKKIEDISQKLELFLYQNNKNKIIEQGFKKVEKFRWSNCAKETLNFYDA